MQHASGYPTNESDGKENVSMNCRGFACGVILGAAAAMTVLPMTDPIIRARMMRCGKRAMRRARSGIESLI